MNPCRSDATYEVTISDELRALRHVRNSPAAMWESSAPKPTDAPAAASTVFKPRRFRRDGRRPLTVKAGELLRIEVREASPRLSDRREDRAGFQAVSLFITEDGKCLAQVCVEPPDGRRARPAYRLAIMQQTADLLAVVKACQLDTSIHASAYASPSERLPVSGSGKCLSDELVKALAPFVETT